MIDYITFRILYAMQEEARAWSVYRDPFGKFVATDDGRIHRFNPSDGLKEIPDIWIERTPFDTQGAAAQYIHYRSMRAGVIHALCFWRKDA